MRISCVCHRLLEETQAILLYGKGAFFFFLHMSLFSGERSGDGDMPKSLRDGKIDKETEREIQRKREERERERADTLFALPYSSSALPPLVLRSRPPAGRCRLLHEERDASRESQRPPGSASLPTSWTISRCADLRSLVSLRRRRHHRQEVSALKL